MKLHEIWAICVFFNWFFVFRTVFNLKSELNLKTGTVFVLYNMFFSFIFDPVWTFCVFFYLFWVKNEH